MELKVINESNNLSRTCSVKLLEITATDYKKMKRLHITIFLYSSVEFKYWTKGSYFLNSRTDF